LQTNGTTGMKYHINSRSWEQILLFLEREKDIHTSKETPLRQFIEAVWYVARSGCQWRLLPDSMGVGELSIDALKDGLMRGFGNA
jgi:transposase